MENDAHNPVTALSALNTAALNIARNLELEKVLQQIVDSARNLVSAEYGALGVPNASGRMETFVTSGMSRQQVNKIPHLPVGLGLLGALIREQVSIRLPDLKVDSRSSGFPEGHPPMKSFLGVPIVAGKLSLGNLYLTNKIGAEEFSMEDQQMVELLATHAAVAIQNARLYEQVSHLAIVAERARIGMDLHDGVIQNIYAVGLTLESTRMILTDEPDEAMNLINRAIEGLNEAIRDIRNFILDLKPRRFDGDLSQGLSRLIREFQANTMVPVTRDVDEMEIARLPGDISRAIFFTTQEAFANIARHAHAQHVELTLGKADGNGVRLSIKDDGRGFDVSLQDRMVGHGLANMRERAYQHDGEFRIQSVPGQGTRVTLTFLTGTDD